MSSQNSVLSSSFPILPPALFPAISSACLTPECVCWCRACSSVSRCTFIDIKDRRSFESPVPSSPQAVLPANPLKFDAVALISELFVLRGSIEPDHLPSRTEPTARADLLLASLTSFLFSAVVALNPHRLRSLALALMF